MPEFIPNQFEEKIIAFDYDGTLTEKDSFPAPGIVPEKMHKLLDKLALDGYKFVINTSRRSLDVDIMRENSGILNVQTGKPVADLYLDDKGLLPNNIDLLEAFIEQYFNTQTDYLAKLTSGSLTSEYAKNIENVPENPAYFEKTDENFKVYIPVTGGMDSSTLWQMAIESGYPVHPIYIDAGQEYAQLEIGTAQKIVSKSGYTLEVINLDLPYKKFDYILLARNAAVIYTIAQKMKERGEWGEIWFGNLAGESPIHGGDKSRRFFNDTQALLNLRGFDVRIMNPLIGIDKPDEVAYWKSRDINELINSKSCFDAHSHQCGKCQTCFRKWAAFIVHDIDISDTFADKDIKTNFQPYIEKYRERMGKASREKDYRHYSPSRIETTLRAIDKI